MKVLSIIGHFAFGKKFLDGQTVKTKIITEELELQLGKDQVIKIDTHGKYKTLLKAPFQVLKALKKSRNILMFPAHNGIRVFAPLLHFFRKFFKNRKLHYAVIGGWLPDFLKDRKRLIKALSCFDGIYVETNTMKVALEKLGLKNLYVVPNCKKLNILTSYELIYPSGVPYRLCIFSRVMREKGIETAINVIRNINSKLGHTVYSLDIYGPVDPSQVEWFEDVQKNFPDYVHYNGCVDASKSVEVLRDYFALLFPTHFYTEGIPGTIIDAYAAGIPVISAKWASYADMVDEGITGYGYTFDDESHFEQIMLDIANKPDKILSLKKNCIDKAKNYIPETVVRLLTDRFDGYDLYPLKLCTFSRVMREKGIEDAVNAVKIINDKYGKTLFTLDIFGQVDPEQVEWFDSLKKNFPEYVNYKGVVDFDKTTEVLKSYCALLFPTYYEGEGFAGTLIDAMAAGVPVIASDWKYNKEVVKDGATGLLYETHNQEQFIDKIEWIANNLPQWFDMKKNAINEAKNYLPGQVVTKISDNMG